MSKLIEEDIVFSKTNEQRTVHCQNVFWSSCESVFDDVLYDLDLRVEYKYDDKIDNISIRNRTAVLEYNTETKTRSVLPLSSSRLFVFFSSFRTRVVP